MTGINNNNHNNNKNNIANVIIMSSYAPISSIFGSVARQNQGIKQFRKQCASCRRGARKLDMQH